MGRSINEHQQKILVLGAGELGIEIIRQLAIQGIERSTAQVSVLLRSPPRHSSDPSRIRMGEELASLGVDIVFGDVVSASVSDLAQIFKPFDTVVSCVGFAAGAGTQMKITRAAIESDIARYFPWQFGCDYDVIGLGSAQPVFDEQFEVRTLLRSQDRLAWVIISTGMFTSFLFEPYFGVVNLKRNEVNALGSWDTEVSVTTPEDIGALTAKLLLTQEDVNNRIFYTAGDTLSYGHLADLVDAVLGRTVSRAVWTVPFLTAELEKDPDDAIKRYRVVFAEGKGVAWDKSVTFNEQNNIAVTTVEQWMQNKLI
nr:aromatic alcohol reductase [uncultured Pseudomonas sp.]